MKKLLFILFIVNVFAKDNNLIKEQILTELYGNYNTINQTAEVTFSNKEYCNIFYSDMVYTDDFLNHRGIYDVKIEYENIPFSDAFRDARSKFGISIFLWNNKKYHTLTDYEKDNLCLTFIKKYYNGNTFFPKVTFLTPFGENNQYVATLEFDNSRFAPSMSTMGTTIFATRFKFIDNNIEIINNPYKLFYLPHQYSINTIEIVDLDTLSNNENTKGLKVSLISNGDYKSIEYYPLLSPHFEEGNYQNYGENWHNRLTISNLTDIEFDFDLDGASRSGATCDMEGIASIKTNTTAIFNFSHYELKEITGADSCIYTFTIEDGIIDVSVNNSRCERMACGMRQTMLLKYTKVDSTK